MLFGVSIRISVVIIVVARSFRGIWHVLAIGAIGLRCNSISVFEVNNYPFSFAFFGCLLDFSTLRIDYVDCNLK